MQEERWNRFKLGKKILDEMVYGATHPQNQKFTPEIHITRVSGINPRRDLYECIGFLVGLATNFVKNPGVVYRAMFSKYED